MRNDGIKKMRLMYMLGLVLVFIAGFALVTCSCILFKIVPNFPIVGFVITSVALLFYNLVSSGVYFRLLETAQNQITRYYIVNKVVRMIFTFMVLIVYLMFWGTEPLAYVIGIFVLYIMLLIYESVFWVQIEKRINEIKSNK